MSFEEKIKMLETIRELRHLLEDAIGFGHARDCWIQPCTCGYESWWTKVVAILHRGEE